MMLGRRTKKKELINLCAEARPLLRILNEQGYDIDQVQEVKIIFSVYRGPVIQLSSQEGIRTDIEFPMKIWELVQTYFWRDKRRFEREPRFIFNWR